jgi:putative pyruvate formate lyase activating enzyme
MTAIGSAPTVSARRASLAMARVTIARELLSSCNFCAHACGTNRYFAQGFCQAGPRPKFFSAQVETGDELEFIPAFAVALSGCDLRCEFCITGRESWDASAGISFEPAEVADRATEALRNGARAVMLLGGEPTIHLPAVLEFVSRLPEEAMLVLKTNGYCSKEVRELLDDLFDCWLFDFKFGNDQCAARLAHIPDYLKVLGQNLHWAHRRSNLVIRHLLLPGHLQCCWEPIARWIVSEMPEVKVSLRSSFWPAWRWSRRKDLPQTVTADEEQEARAFAAELGLQLVE